MTQPQRLALSVRQPWAWLIVNGFKDIENRDWRTRHRGPVLIHAAKTLDQTAHELVRNGFHPVTGDNSLHGNHYALQCYLNGDLMRGGIVGAVEIVDVVEQSDSPWFVGRYGFVLRKAQPFRRFYPMRGMPGLFPVGT